MVLVLSFCLTPTVLSNQVHTDMLEKYNETQEVSESDEQNFALPVWVSAIPKIFISGKPVFFWVIFPMFLVDGYIHYDFDDGTFSDDKNFVKHRFVESGTYQVHVEFDTIFGFSAQGKTRVFII